MLSEAKHLVPQVFFQLMGSIRSIRTRSFDFAQDDVPYSLAWIEDYRSQYQILVVLAETAADPVATGLEGCSYSAGGFHSGILSSGTAP